ncbi:MAG: hypothetical protein J6P47_00700, partial [Acetobacter sp.]|nr:hypothetical protein [Acetobacter sp.]
AYMNQAATKELKELDLVENFAYPKGVEFLKKIIEHSTNEDSIILDFFAGSGTTGEAVMRFNAEHAAKSEETLGGGEEWGAFYFGAAA